MEDPKTVASAINGSDSEGWQKDIDKEMSALEPTLFTIRPKYHLTLD